jgi:hypothetical protein
MQRPLSFLRFLLLKRSHLASEIQDLANQLSLWNLVLFYWWGFRNILRFGRFNMQKWDKNANLEHIHKFSVECLLQNTCKFLIFVKNFLFVLDDQITNCYAIVLEKLIEFIWWRWQIRLLLVIFKDWLSLCLYVTLQSKFFKLFNVFNLCSKLIFKYFRSAKF